MKGNCMSTTIRDNRETEARSAESEQFVVPTASVVEENDAYTLRVEMPGVTKESLEMSTENNELTIIGRRSLPTIDGTLIHYELRRENFRRMFELDPSIDANKISA